MGAQLLAPSRHHGGDGQVRPRRLTAWAKSCEANASYHWVRQATLPTLRAETPSFCQNSLREPCTPSRNGPCCPIELRPNDLASPRTPRPTDDLSPNAERTGWAGACLSIHAYPKEELDGTRNREVVQQPKRLRLHPTG